MLSSACADNDFDKPEACATSNAADADRISRRSQRACDRGIPCRAIPPQRVSLPRRFAFAQTQNLSSAGCADSLRPLRFARVQRR